MCPHDASDAVAAFWELVEELVESVSRSLLGQSSLPIALSKAATTGLRRRLGWIYEAELKHHETEMREGDPAMTVFDHNKDQLHLAAKEEIQRLSRPSGTRSAESDADLVWPNHGRVRNIQTYRSIMPTIVELRRQLWGTALPLGNSQIVPWLIDQDSIESGCRDYLASICMPDEVADKVFEADDRLIAIGPGLESSHLLALEIAYDPIPIFNDDKAVAAIIRFTGPKTASLARVARRLEESCGDFQTAIWLILTGVWPGTRSLRQSRRAGRPNLSIEQEYLAQAAIDAQLMGGSDPSAKGYYDGVLTWWNRLSDKIRVSYPDHPRFDRFDGRTGEDCEDTVPRFQTTESVRKALARIRKVIGCASDPWL